MACKYLAEQRDKARADIPEWLYLDGVKYKFEHEYQGRVTWKLYPAYALGVYSEITQHPNGEWTWGLWKGRKFATAYVLGKTYPTAESAHRRCEEEYHRWVNGSQSSITQKIQRYELDRKNNGHE